MGSDLVGRYHVRALRSAFEDASGLMPRLRDRMELRRHALKLRHWPDNVTTEPSGLVVDLDWSWIRALPGKQVGELRIGDVIGGCDNLRVIFHIAPAAEDGGMPLAWVLAVMQKKRDDFTRHNIATFNARRTLVRQRFYGLDG